MSCAAACRGLLDGKVIMESKRRVSDEQSAPVARGFGASIFVMPSLTEIQFPTFDVVWPGKRVFVAMGIGVMGAGGAELAPVTKAIMASLRYISETESYRVMFLSNATEFNQAMAQIRDLAVSGEQYLFLLPNPQELSDSVALLGARMPPSKSLH